MDHVLSPDQRAFAKRLVEKGKYASEAEVVQAGMRLLEAREAREELLALIDEADEEVRRGEAIPNSPELWESIDRMIEEGLRSGAPVSDHVKPR